MASFVLAEFNAPAPMLAAAAALRANGHRHLDAHSPYPLKGANRALGIAPSPIPKVVLGAALTGGILGYLLQWWCNAVDYPILVGGRPLHSFPAFVPITFEVTILFASLAAFLCVLGLSGMPRPYHPVFEAEQFRSASIDKFWISVMVSPDRDADEVARELRLLHAETVLRTEGPI